MKLTALILICSCGGVSATGCKTSRSEVTTQNTIPQNVASPPVKDNSTTQSAPPHDNKSDDKTELPSYTANPEPPPPLFSKGTGESQASNGRGNRLRPSVESRASSASRPKEPQGQLKKRGFLARWLHINRK